MDNNMPAFLKRAAEGCGFSRDSFIEKNIPTISSNIIVFPFFGDLRSTFVLSAFLLKRYKELKANKYLILCTWPGHQDLFPYVDEYWTIKDPAAIKSLASNANNFYNHSELSTTYTRNLIRHFENVISFEELEQFYNNGFQTKFWDTFKEIKLYLPEVPSVNRMSDSFKGELTRKAGQKVVLYPVQNGRSWQRGRNEHLAIPKEFWKTLITEMLEAGFAPIVYQNQFTYDMSPDFGAECIYLVPKDISHVLCAMRAAGCVLDLYSGVSRLAIAARCPYLAVDERQRFMELKDYEIDDLCGEIPRQYIFSFSSLILTGSEKDWKTGIIENVIVRLNKFLPTLNRDSWLSPNESYETVSYDKVRERNIKKMGVRFIKKY